MKVGRRSRRGRDRAGIFDDIAPDLSRGVSRRLGLILGIPTLVHEICPLMATPRARLKSGAESTLSEWLLVGRAEIFALP